MKVLGRRVDWLTLAYRVRLLPDLVELLRLGAARALEHGRARFEWPDTSFRVGYEIRHTRIAGVWNLENGDVRIRIDPKAPGAPELEAAGVDLDQDEPPEERNEPGWTVELVWSAQALARRLEAGHSLVGILDEARALVDTFGEVLAERLRRVDLCADVVGWKVDAGDAARLVKRPHASLRRYPNVPDDEASWAHAVVHSSTEVNALAVGKDRLMARLYNKVLELAKKSDAVQLEERARWTAAGWDGEAPITRVEFQIRGEAVRAFGMRDPRRLVDPLTMTTSADVETGELLELDGHVDRVWQTCLYWVRLLRRPVRDGEAPSRVRDSKTWELLRAVSFRSSPAEGPSRPLTRRILRSGCRPSQMLGAMLSVLAASSRLPHLPEAPAAYVEAPRQTLDTMIDKLLAEAREVLAPWLVERYGGEVEACVHLAVRVNAARARVEEIGAFFRDQRRHGSSALARAGPGHGSRAASEVHHEHLGIGARRGVDS